MKEVSDRLAACGVANPWSTADAEAWWTAHRSDLQVRHHTDVQAPAWSDAERADQVKKGVDQLQRHFERSHIDIGELDRRLALLKQAIDRAAVAAVLSDLPRLDEPVVAEVVDAGKAPAQALVMAPSSELMIIGQPVVSVMSSFVRRFELTPGTMVKAVAVMGHAMLDFRGGVGGPGVVEARIVAVMGSIEIIVPPDIHVEIISTGFWGSVEQLHADAPASPDKPTLRITGVAVMGSIEVKTSPDERGYWEGPRGLPDRGRGRRRLNR
jgi:hypothetical protein